MTAAPENAAPIPADVRAIADAIASTWHLLSYPSKVVLSDDIAGAILADRAARPSAVEEIAPTSEAEERIREDEPGYLIRIEFREGRSGGLRISSPDVPGLILSHHDEPAILADMVEVLRTADRSRLRKGGAHGE